MKTELVELKALWASAEHWLDNWEMVVRERALPRRYIDSPTCPLCCLHKLPQSRVDCSKCVIKRHTRKPGCDATPWYGVFVAVSGTFDGEQNGEALEHAVLEEYQFLVDLALQESQAL